MMNVWKHAQGFQWNINGKNLTIDISLNQTRPMKNEEVFVMLKHMKQAGIDQETIGVAVSRNEYGLQYPLKNKFDVHAT